MSVLSPLGLRRLREEATRNDTRDFYFKRATSLGTLLLLYAAVISILLIITKVADVVDRYTIPAGWIAGTVVLACAAIMGSWGLLKLSNSQLRVRARVAGHSARRPGVPVLRNETQLKHVRDGVQGDVMLVAVGSYGTNVLPTLLEVLESLGFADVVGSILVLEFDAVVRNWLSVKIPRAFADRVVYGSTMSFAGGFANRSYDYALGHIRHWGPDIVQAADRATEVHFRREGASPREIFLLLSTGAQAPLVIPVLRRLGERFGHSRTIAVSAVPEYSEFRAQFPALVRELERLGIDGWLLANERDRAAWGIAGLLVSAYAGSTGTGSRTLANIFASVFRGEGPVFVSPHVVFRDVAVFEAGSGQWAVRRGDLLRAVVEVLTELRRTEGPTTDAEADSLVEALALGVEPEALSEIADLLAVVRSTSPEQLGSNDVSMNSIVSRRLRSTLVCPVVGVGWSRFGPTTELGFLQQENESRISEHAGSSADPVQLGKLIRLLRQELLLSQEELAVRADVPVAALRDIELGSSSPIRLPVIDAVATALDVNAASLVMPRDASERVEWAALVTQVAMQEDWTVGTLREFLSAAAQQTDRGAQEVRAEDIRAEMRMWLWRREGG